MIIAKGDKMMLARHAYLAWDDSSEIGIFTDKNDKTFAFPGSLLEAIDYGSKDGSLMIYIPQDSLLFSVVYIISNSIVDLEGSEQIYERYNLNNVNSMYVTIKMVTVEPVYGFYIELPAYVLKKYINL